MTELSDQLALRLPWQTQQWQQLETLIGEQRMPHALLLAGPGGIGKSRFAHHLAHYLLCESPQLSAACGSCRLCQLLAAGSHPDLYLLQPEAKGKQIKVDQIRTLVDSVGHTAQMAHYKVAIIEPAEAMNRNAANALLKCLEEPTERTLLILCSDTPGALMATIRSRCQVLRFTIPAAQQSIEWLTALSPSAPAQQLLTEADQRPLRALQMFEEESLEQRQAMAQSFAAMLAGEKSPVDVAEGWKSLEMSEVLDWLAQRVEQAIRGSAAESGQLARTRSLFLLRDQIYGLIKSLASGANPNVQLALEALLFESCEKFINS